jgi:hypothetical protein
MRKKPGNKKGFIPEAVKPYQFKPGQSGNPSGRPKMDPKARVLKELTLQSYQKCIEAVCTGNIAALAAMADDPEVSALQAGIASSLARAIREGDYETVEKITQRIIGKIPDEINVNSRNTNLNANLNATVDEMKVKAALKKLEFDV